MDVIREAMHNELGYAVTAKYKSYTHQLLEAYQTGEDIASVDLSPAAKPNNNRPFKNVDGIKFLNHQGGCGGIRQDAAVLSKLLAAYADHPNVGGVTVLSLGCQNLQVQDFKNDLKQHNPNFDKPLFVFEQQQSQSEEQLIAEAIRKINPDVLALVEIESKEALTEFRDLYLKDLGYIKNFKTVSDDKQGILRIYLKFDEENQHIIHEITRVSTPGRRVYVGKDEIPMVKNGLGCAILSA